MSANKDLQINHKIIRFLEEAKAQSEMVLDALPGLFAVIPPSSMKKHWDHIEPVSKIKMVKFVR